MFASSDEVVDFQVAFPPGKKYFYVPAKLVYRCNLFGGQVQPAGGDPILNAVDLITDKSQWFFGLINVWCTE